MERLTKQRKALIECLKQTTRGPLSIEEMHTHLLKEIPDIHISTVYRNVRSLIAEKIICAVTIANGDTRYEIPRTQHHHHFHCGQCNRVYDISFCPKEINAMVPEGFVMLDHCITLNGYCRSCKPS